LTTTLTTARATVTSGGGNAFNGALDEVRLYDTVLSDAEALELAGK